ncbi:MAG: hypothetical protein HQK59_14770, partial [Deltaproteobacteria bacterium]|nr:hypothetical protein [Deltaproteobacteria bacterium]
RELDTADSLFNQALELAKGRERCVPLYYIGRIYADRDRYADAARAYADVGLECADTGGKGSYQDYRLRLDQLIIQFKRKPLEDYIVEVRRLFGEQKYDAAILEARSGVYAYPESFLASFYLAVALVNSGNVPEGMEWANRMAVVFNGQDQELSQKYSTEFYRCRDLVGRYQGNLKQHEIDEVDLKEIDSSLAALKKASDIQIRFYNILITHYQYNKDAVAKFTAPAPVDIHDIKKKGDAKVSAYLDLTAKRNGLQLEYNGEFAFQEFQGINNRLRAILGTLDRSVKSIDAQMSEADRMRKRGELSDFSLTPVKVGLAEAVNTLGEARALLPNMEEKFNTLQRGAHSQSANLRDDLTYCKNRFSDLNTKLAELNKDFVAIQKIQEQEEKKKSLPINSEGQAGATTPVQAPDQQPQPGR